MRHWLMAFIVALTSTSAFPQDVDASLAAEIREVCRSGFDQSLEERRARLDDFVRELESRYAGNEETLYVSCLAGAPRIKDEGVFWHYHYMNTIFAMPADKRLELICVVMGRAEEDQRWVFPLLIESFVQITGPDEYFAFLARHLGKPTEGAAHSTHDPLIEVLVNLYYVQFLEHCARSLVSEERFEEIDGHRLALLRAGSAFSEEDLTPAKREQLIAELGWFARQPEWWLRQFAPRHMGQFVRVELDEVLNVLDEDRDPRVNRATAQLYATLELERQAKEIRDAAAAKAAAGDEPSN